MPLFPCKKQQVCDQSRKQSQLLLCVSLCVCSKHLSREHLTVTAFPNHSWHCVTAVVIVSFFYSSFSLLLFFFWCLRLAFDKKPKKNWFWCVVYMNIVQRWLLVHLFRQSFEGMHPTHFAWNAHEPNRCAQKCFLFVSPRLVSFLTRAVVCINAYVMPWAAFTAVISILLQWNSCFFFLKNYGSSFKTTNLRGFDKKIIRKRIDLSELETFKCSLTLYIFHFQNNFTTESNENWYLCAFYQVCMDSMEYEQHFSHILRPTFDYCTIYIWFPFKTHFFTAVSFKLKVGNFDFSAFDSAVVVQLTLQTAVSV